MVEVVAKKWGNSIGIIIPKEIADELGLRDGSKITAAFRKPKKTVLEEMFGALEFSEPTEKLLAESRKGFSKWM